MIFTGTNTNHLAVSPEAFTASGCSSTPPTSPTPPGRFLFQRPLVVILMFQQPLEVGSLLRQTHGSLVLSALQHPLIQGSQSF